MTTHTAIVDDRDPAIAYSGSWLLGGVAEEFDGTTTAPTGQNAATAAFSFVAVWTSPSLSPNDGLHNLVIKQTSVVSDTVIFLDYIMFTTTTSASVSAYFVDDRDARIQYSGNPAWKLFGSDGDFQQTSQASQAQGDSLTFQFEGKSISFYGGVTSMTVNASMSIDGGPPTFWVPPTTASLTNDLIFDSGDLTPGIHTLVVTATNDQPVWADYFLVMPNPPGSVPSSSSVGSSSSSSASPSFIGSNSNAQSNAVNATPIGTIVGVVVGIGLPLILGLSLFICRCRRRRVEGQQRSGLAQNRVFSFSLSSVEGQGRGGMILSNKLTRAMEMAGQWPVATVPSASTSSATLTGETGQQRENRGAPPPVYEE
ncbi:hypothetical protein R3P38DRAFT_2960297 [Favolaschia claudopus]|uniref:Uncharacterized protein n=1 Tax=Favolaschia claudopus TaxID=2862362 RepID=A0AAW0B7Z6_9AGAR